MFAGTMKRASATVLNLGASVWVMDPAVQTVANTIGMPDYVLDAVRSMQGVSYAVPIYSGGALLKLADGTYQAATVIGLDDATLFGRPQLLQGKIEDIYGENAFIVVKDPEFRKLQNPHIGSEFQVNDHRGVIVGIATVHDRLKEKDAWDIYFTLVNYPGGLDALAGEVRPHLDNGLVHEGFRKIAEKFASTEHVGPKFVADFEDIQEQEARAIRMLRTA